jgi:hypothetical protein
MGRGENVRVVRALLNSWSYFCSKVRQDVAKDNIAETRAFGSGGIGGLSVSSSVRILPPPFSAVILSILLCNHINSRSNFYETYFSKIDTNISVGLIPRLLYLLGSRTEILTEAKSGWIKANMNFLREL